MRTLQLAVVLAVTPCAAQTAAPTLAAAVVPGSTEAVVGSVAPGSLCALVLGTTARSWPLPGGAVLGLEPLVVAGIGSADAEGRCALSARFPIGSGAGASFLAQCVVLDPRLPFGAPGALAVTPLRSLRVPEPGATAEIVVLFGQSNMEGQAAVADLPPSLRGPMPCARIWNDVARGFQALTAGVNNTTLLNPAWAGPEMALADKLCQGERVVHFVKFAVGQTALGPVPGPWNEWGCRAGELYVELLRRVDAACAAARALGLQPRVTGICMMQGESDAVDALLAAGYGPRLQDLIAQLRADLEVRGVAGAAPVPFVLGLIDGELSRFGVPGVEQVRKAQLAATAALPACAAVETTGLPLQQDGVHFATAGVAALGCAFAQALLDCGWSR